jgi:secondary thiamine-phosphate synthase enzyme
MYLDKIDVSLRTGPDIQEVSHLFDGLIKKSGVANGTLSACMVGSTGSITTIEYEPGVIEDLKRAVNQMAPPGLDYAHERAWHDGNGHSHVQAALMGPSQSFPVRDGRLKLGTWQQVVAINHDNRSRKRTIEVTIIGTPK